MSAFRVECLGHGCFLPSTQSGSYSTCPWWQVDWGYKGRVWRSRGLWWKRPITRKKVGGARRQNTKLGLSFSSCCCCFQLLQYLWQRQENNNVDTKPILDVTATAHVPTVQSISWEIFANNYQFDKTCFLMKKSPAWLYMRLVFIRTNLEVCWGLSIWVTKK